MRNLGAPGNLLASPRPDPRRPKPAPGIWTHGVPSGRRDSSRALQCRGPHTAALFSSSRVPEARGDDSHRATPSERLHRDHLPDAQRETESSWPQSPRPNPRLQSHHPSGKSRNVIPLPDAQGRRSQHRTAASRCPPSSRTPKPPSHTPEFNYRPRRSQAGPRNARSPSAFIGRTGFVMKTRRLPTLTVLSTTIGATGLTSVFGMGTGVAPSLWAAGNICEQWKADNGFNLNADEDESSAVRNAVKPVDRLVPVSLSPHGPYTSGLLTS